MPRVDIALALYNGAQYLPDFLQSLSEQSFKDWRLVVRDDGSTDHSVDLIKQWARTQSQPVEFVEDRRGNLRVIQNFAACFVHTSAPYVMPADQDDVWFYDKLQQAVTEMERLEAIQGADAPLASYCDLQVVDAELREIHPSMLAMQGQGDRREPSLPQLLSQNVAPGCSMIVNRALLDRAMPIPSGVAMHDWWLLLVAASLGRFSHIRKPGLAYRQHGGNQVGAQAGGLSHLIRQAVNGRASYLSRLRQAQVQAQELAKLLPPNHPHQSLLRTFATLDQMPPVVRQWKAWRAGLGKVGPLRNAAFYFMM